MRRATLLQFEARARRAGLRPPHVDVPSQRRLERLRAPVELADAIVAGDPAPAAPARDTGLLLRVLAAALCAWAASYGLVILVLPW